MQPRPFSSDANQSIVVAYLRRRFRWRFRFGRECFFNCFLLALALRRRSLFASITSGFGLNFPVLFAWSMIS